MLNHKRPKIPKIIPKDFAGAITILDFKIYTRPIVI